jgi:hypothetical protein
MVIAGFTWAAWPRLRLAAVQLRLGKEQAACWRKQKLPPRPGDPRALLTGLARRQQRGAP